ncbi:MAG: TlpA disulfide reductase family protein [Gemmatimonadetes bacterium]|jgi:thiol-disulfide isomerase/thioredoxin|nr:TlpA disulfide reductase family protein [Gemmatimonadota bacterium]
MPEPTSGPTPTSSKRLLVWGERLLTVGLLVFVAYRLGPQMGALVGVSSDEGREPVYEVTTFDGHRVRSADLLGQVVVVNFWATWCGPCKLEMPSLQSLHEDKADLGVVVLGLSTDVGGQAGIESFLSEREITYSVGRATQQHRQAFGGIHGTPTTFIIDKTGVVRHRVVGYFAPPALRVAVNRLLNEEPVPATPDGD